MTDIKLFLQATEGSAYGEDFKEIMREGCSPSCYWDCIAAGSFKECYDIGSSNVIVKFASSENNTQGEKRVLQSAKENGLLEFFPTTIFIPLSIPLPIEYICNAEEDAVLCYAIVQEKAALIATPNEIRTDDIIESQEWLANAYKWYGLEKMTTLYDFIQDEGITDLRNDNLGYLSNGKPVILDWLS